MAYCSSYYLYQRYEKRGGQEPIPSYPNVYSIDGEGSKPLRARQMYDTDCGWIPDTEVQNRTLSGTPYCTGYDLYVNKTYQVSYDGGITWETTGNEDALVERNSADCGYVPPPPMYRWVNVTPTSDPNSYWCEECSSGYSNQYLTFVAIDSGTFSFSGTSSSTIDNSSIEYSLDSGSTWNTLNRGVQSPTITAGNKIMWRSIWLRPQISSNEGTGFFASTGRFNVEGNAMSLFYETFQDKTSFSGVGSNAFRYLFRNCTGLVSAENLVLPATTLTNYCYEHMFQGCTSLTSIPELPARTLTAGCYEYMFAGCTALTTVPSNYLPTTTLANHCYRSMFFCCSSLTSVPELPATTLTDDCYQSMFYGCTSLTSVPSNYLPSTTLAEGCYGDMFSGCTSLTAAPQLPATTLAYYCYFRMFEKCTSLTSSPALPATTLAEGCYGQMFDGCTSLRTASDLPATTLADNCYRFMYSNCPITTPPVLSATTLASGCCYAMFAYCSSLTTAPVLSATTLADDCYAFMFYDCPSLNYIKCLATSISANNCTYFWVYNVASSGTFAKKSSVTWSTGSSGIPSGWSYQNA